MYKPGDRVEMTKGYKGISGVIRERTGSAFEIYIVVLDIGIKIAAGPSAFSLRKGAQ